MKNDTECIQFPLLCIVPGCSNVKSATSDRSFFSLPKDQEWHHKWLTACKREDLLKSMELNLAVCSDHFTAEQLSGLSSKTLQDDVIPSVFSLSHRFSSEDVAVETDSICEESNSKFLPTTQIKLEPDIDCYLDVDSDGVDEDVISIKQMGQLCRLCANKARDVIYIFSSIGKELNIENKINSSLPVLIQKTDSLPKQLCSSCVLKLDVCYQFSQSCIMAERKLKSLMKLQHFWSHSLGETQHSFPFDKNLKEGSITESENDVNGKSSNFNLKMGPFSEVQNMTNTMNTVEDINNLYCCPLCCEGKMTIHTENISDPQSSEETDDKMDGVSCSSNHSVELKELNNGNKMRESTDKVSVDMNHLQNNLVYEVRDEKGNNFTLIESNIGWWHDRNSLENAEIIIETLNSQDNVLCDVEDDANNWNLSNEMDIDNTNALCQFCRKTFSSVKQCLNHSKVHAVDGCYPCSLCGMVCNTELDITSHYEQHKIDDKKARSNISKGRITCNKCGRRFNNERTLNDHTCGNIESKQFRCEMCKKAYISEERLIFHRKFHEGARPNYCGQCGKEFDNEGSLYYHTKMVHEGARPFCCEECGKRFYSRARLERHKRVHSGERPFECEICCRRFYDHETLKGHYITHMSVKPFQCDLCGVCCGRKSMLKQHMQTHHTDSYMPKRFPSLIHYFCKICDKTFTSSSDVLTHRTTHWGTIQNADNENKVPKSHVCEFCGESFTMINLLGRHRKQEHPDEQPYVCSVCKETSRTLYEARAHRKTHTSFEPENKEKLKTDQDNTECQNVFICEECGKPLPGRRRFIAHMKTHQMDLPFVCTVCGRKFAEKQRLLVHMRLHTGEKPYSCKDCGKRFTQSSALYTHVLLHTGEKPHGCDICGKAFRIKADRDNHRRSLIVVNSAQNSFVPGKCIISIA